MSTSQRCTLSWEEPDAVARYADLATVVGATCAHDLLRRSAEHLGEIAADGAPIEPRDAWRTTGLAAMFGYRQLERIWRRLAEAADSDPKAVIHARAAAAAARRLALSLLAQAAPN